MQKHLFFMLVLGNNAYFKVCELFIIFYYYIWTTYTFVDCAAVLVVIISFETDSLLQPFTSKLLL
jgi:hypothetical protein